MLSGFDSLFCRAGRLDVHFLVKMLPRHSQLFEKVDFCLALDVCNTSKKKPFKSKKLTEFGQMYENEEDKFAYLQEALLWILLHLQ